MLISNRNSFRVLFDEIASVYFTSTCEKHIYMLAMEMASLGNPRCANCIGTLSFSIKTGMSKMQEKVLELFPVVFISEENDVSEVKC